MIHKGHWTVWVSTDAEEAEWREKTKDSVWIVVRVGEEMITRIADHTSVSTAAPRFHHREGYDRN